MRLRTVGLSLTALLFLAADSPKPDASAIDLEKMQGNWAAASYVRDGLKVPDDDAQALFRTVKGNEYIVFRYDQEIGRGTFKIDATKRPRTIDLIPSTGTAKGKPMLGLYEIEGDTYKVIVALPGARRPGDFVSKEGSGLIFTVWERETKK